jgi:AAA+ ATPase superfamily predicted ATPase
MAIHKDKKWLKAIEQKSKEKHISLDSCINLDALWMAEQEAIDMQKKEFDAKVNDFKIAIKKDKKWLNDIAKKAKEKNISLDSCITLDAKWMAEQEMKDK